MVNDIEPNPDEPRRVRAFANFFKRYMSLSSVITAALPIPVTAFGLIPTFKAHTNLLSVYTPLFCFLLLGYIFYSRHQLARLMFPEYFDDRFANINNTNTTIKIKMSPWFPGHRFVSILPLLLICFSVLSIFEYHRLLDQAIAASLDFGLVDPQIIGTAPIRDNWENALLYTSSENIENSQLLIVFYLGIFLSAEAAFILMAIKEYLQDLVKLSEIDLIRGPNRVSNDAVKLDNESPSSD